MSTPATAITAPDRAELAAASDLLERLLRGLLEGHQRLLQCVERKRKAISLADINAVTRTCQEEATILSRVEEIEKHRTALMLKLGSLIGAPPGVTLTVSSFAATLAEPQQTRILAIAAQLRETLVNLKRQSSVIRAAADSLSRHMTGIVHSVHSALNRARVYGSRGTIAGAAALPSIVDIKS